MSDPSDNDEDVFIEGTTKPRLTAADRKALIATTQLTELEMVELWNQYKFNFPTGKANHKQLKQLIRKVPRANLFWVLKKSPLVSYDSNFGGDLNA